LCWNEWTTDFQDGQDLDGLILTYHENLFNPWSISGERMDHGIYRMIRILEGKKTIVGRYVASAALCLYRSYSVLTPLLYRTYPEVKPLKPPFMTIALHQPPLLMSFGGAIEHESNGLNGFEGV
jgi:hypothetical protein